MNDEKKSSDPVPPKDLSPESASWWRDVVESYDLQPHHVHLLTLAARCLDRAEAARVMLRKDGLIYKDSHGVRRASPATVIEKNCAVTYARLLRELRLDNTTDDDTDRIPRNSLNWKRRHWIAEDRRRQHDSKTATP